MAHLQIGRLELIQLFFLDARCQNGGRAASHAQKVLLVLIRKKCCLFAIKDKEWERENNSLALVFSFNHEISWNIFKRLYHTILGASSFHNVRRAVTEEFCKMKWNKPLFVSFWFFSNARISALIGGDKKEEGISVKILQPTRVTLSLLLLLRIFPTFPGTPGFSFKRISLGPYTLGALVPGV